RPPRLAAKLRQRFGVPEAVSWPWPLLLILSLSTARLMTGSEPRCCSDPSIRTLREAIHAVLDESISTQGVRFAK
ncbi:MAG: hypothetical protein ACI88C_003109, partial [Acidimicrobiales bacterium]